MTPKKTATQQKFKQTKKTCHKLKTGGVLQLVKGKDFPKYFIKNSKRGEKQLCLG